MKFVAVATVAAVVATSAMAAPGSHPNHPSKNQLPGGQSVKEPSYFTSAFSTRAIDSTIVANDGSKPAGQAGAYGHFGYRINSDKQIICWDIRTVGVTGEYASPAVTATHIHQGAAGAAGPPRLAFPNPAFTRKDINGAEIRESKGCMKGPFTTGVLANGVDTGSASGFTLNAIEANPSGFFTDTHTAAFMAGAVRGQLLRSELEVRKPRSFTSTLKTTATPDTIIATTGGPATGLEGAKGYYTLRINTDQDVICYDIKLTGFGTNEVYFSPAKSSTHTHMANAGASGPPRLAYKNPERKRYLGVFKSKTRYSSACIKGPFTTGLLGANGIDTGSASGFTLSQLQDNPAGYFSDVHTESRQAGAVRGQMARA